MRFVSISCNIVGSEWVRSRFSSSKTFNFDEMSEMLDSSRFRLFSAVWRDLESKASSLEDNSCFFVSNFSFVEINVGIVFLISSILSLDYETSFTDTDPESIPVTIESRIFLIPGKFVLSNTS